MFFEGLLTKCSQLDELVIFLTWPNFPNLGKPRYIVTSTKPFRFQKKMFFEGLLTKSSQLDELVIFLILAHFS